MKQKTIEEKRAAVLAYCERVCPKMYCQHKVVDGVLLTSTKTAYDLQIRRDGGFADHFVFPKNGKVQDEIIFLFYRLLGLETSDAVDELNDMMQRRDAVYKELEGNHAKSLKHACRELDLERARNAALVAALEEIAAEKSALDADDRQISIDTLSVHWSAVHRIASEAIEANKKGEKV